MEALERKYDLLIFDSPPVMAVADPIILSGKADLTVFVVRWAKTRRAVVVTALKQISKSGGRVAGVLLSMVDVKKHAGYGFGDSGYYHGNVGGYYSN